MQTITWLRLLAYSDRETFVRQRARDRLEALLRNGGANPLPALAPLEPPLALAAAARRATPRRPRRS